MVASKDREAKNVVRTSAFFDCASEAADNVLKASMRHDARFDPKTSVVG